MQLYEYKVTLVSACDFKVFLKKSHGWVKAVFLKTMDLQGFWPKTMYLKCFGIQLETVYLQGPCSSRPCILRPCCIKPNLNKFYHPHLNARLIFVLDGDFFFSRNIKWQCLNQSQNEVKVELVLTWVLKAVIVIYFTTCNALERVQWVI